MLSAIDWEVGGVMGAPAQTPKSLNESRFPQFGGEVPNPQNHEWNRCDFHGSRGAEGDGGPYLTPKMIENMLIPIVFQEVGGDEGPTQPLKS